MSAAPISGRGDSRRLRWSRARRARRFAERAGWRHRGAAGSNGAGKTTTLKAISSLIRAERGELTSGRIVYEGEAITHADP
ncbi:MAG: Branched-chain amino acid transport ATP-binding protein LivF (TC 3.A.1.4.1) [uncultured Paraburkholderia sp.]|nr:MAG: Branched-chain amino acid transport ATP-binding protein LivF (TC 3.A.1.4.1) [uncultured Paraburkholderia sp.]